MTNPLHKHSREEVCVRDLEIDPRIQRQTLQMTKILRMVRNFNPNALGFATVSRRTNGGLVVLDGMHRVEVVRRITDSNGTMPCEIFDGLSLEEEAEMFLGLNAGNQPSLYDKYRVGIVGGDETLADIDAIVHSMGYTVGSGRSINTINGVQALQRIYAMTPKTEGAPNILLLTLKTVQQAWGSDPHALQTAILEGIANIYKEYDSAVDMGRLVSQLRGSDGGAQGLLTRATTLSVNRKWPRSLCVADLVVDLYNRNLHANSGRSLPVWRRRK